MRSVRQGGANATISVQITREVRGEGGGPAMIKTSSKSDYGIRALVDLAQQGGGGPVPSGEISQRQRIPESLVGQVLGQLRTAGFVRSTRGKQGGHELAVEAEGIRLDAVVEALEGPITLGAGCEQDTAAHADGGCTGAAAQVRLWADVRAAILDVLRDRSIADLASQSASGARYQI